MKIFVLYIKNFGVWAYSYHNKDSNVVKLHEKSLRDNGFTTWIDIITDEEMLGNGAVIPNHFNTMHNK